MKTLKHVIMLAAVLLLLPGASLLYADTGYGKSHGAMEDTSENTGMPPGHMDGFSIDGEASATSEKSQCLTQATVVEMADGYGITFTPEGATHENAVSEQERLARAC